MCGHIVSATSHNRSENAFQKLVEEKMKTHVVEVASSPITVPLLRTSNRILKIRKPLKPIRQNSFIISERNSLRKPIRPNEERFVLRCRNVALDLGDVNEYY